MPGLFPGAVPRDSTVVAVDMTSPSSPAAPATLVSVEVALKLRLLLLNAPHGSLPLLATATTVAVVSRLASVWLELTMMIRMQVHRTFERSM